MNDPPRAMRISAVGSHLSILGHENSLVTRGLKDIDQLIARANAEALAIVEHIHEAVAAGHIEMVRRILDMDPTKANAPDGDGWTPLHVAVCHDQPDSLKLLLERSADTQRTIEGGDGRVLQAGGADPTILSDLDGLEDFRGASPLHLAALLGRTACADLLLSAGADPHAEDAGGFPCLNYAAMSLCYKLRDVQEEQRAEVARQLVTYGADVNARGSDDGLTALHVATARDDISFMAWLIRHGADVNVRDYNRRTPLHLAADPTVVELLLQNGADVNAVGGIALDYPAHGTPLLAAAFDGRPTVVRLLLAYGANVEPFALYFAAHNCDEQTVELLLAHGADANARYRHGITALHAAASATYYLVLDQGNDERAIKTIELLLSYGADVNARWVRDLTPLDLLRTESTDLTANVMAFLVAHGAHSGDRQEAAGAEPPEG